MRHLIALINGFLFGFALVLALHACSLSQASEPTREMVEAAEVAGTAFNIDPNLILAVIEVESSFNPNATGKAGEVGLMQLHPTYVTTAVYDVRRNIFAGTAHLALMRKGCKHQNDLTWLNCYNKGFAPVLKNPKAFPYYKKVLKAYARRLHGQKK